MSDIIERLRKNALGCADETVMRQWDDIRKMCVDMPGASHPRDCFESIIDGYAQNADEAAATIASLREKVEGLEKDKAQAIDWLANATHREDDLNALVAQLRAEGERKDATLREVRAHFRVEYPSSPHGKPAIGYDSEALPKVIALLDIALANGGTNGQA